MAIIHRQYLHPYRRCQRQRFSNWPFLDWNRTGCLFFQSHLSLTSKNVKCSHCTFSIRNSTCGHVSCSLCICNDWYIMQLRVFIYITIVTDRSYRALVGLRTCFEEIMPKSKFQGCMRTCVSAHMHSLMFMCEAFLASLLCPPCKNAGKGRQFKLTLTPSRDGHNSSPIPAPVQKVPTVAIF